MGLSRRRKKEKDKAENKRIEQERREIEQERRVTQKQENIFPPRSGISSVPTSAILNDLREERMEERREAARSVKQ